MKYPPLFFKNNSSSDKVVLASDPSLPFGIHDKSVLCINQQKNELQIEVAR
jgi:hypothetical protein